MASTHKRKGRKPAVRWREGGVHRSQSFETVKEAEKHKARLVLAGVRGGGSSIRIQPAVVRWLEASKTTCSKRTYGCYVGYGHAITNWFGADRRVDAVARADIESWRNKMAGKLHPKTVSNYLRAASAFFSYCLENEWSHKNPCHKVKPPPNKPAEINWYDEGEIAALIEFACDQKNECPKLYQAFIILAARAGLRTGDSRQLRRSEMDFDKRNIYVNRGKSKSARVIHMHADVCRFFMDWPTDGEWLFPKARNRGPGRDEFMSHHISIGVNKWLRDHGFNLMLHGLRHSCISLWAKRIPLHVVARLAGHASLKTTQTYLHARDEEWRQYVEGQETPLRPSSTAESADASPRNKTAEPSEHARRDS